MEQAAKLGRSGRRFLCQFPRREKNSLPGLLEQAGLAEVLADDYTRLAKQGLTAAKPSYLPA